MGESSKGRTRQIVISEPSFELPEHFGHVALVHPEIPQNTGNVARLCAGANMALHLVRPLGFELADRHLKRAGLDYWPGVRLAVHDSVSAFEDRVPSARAWYFSTQGEELVWDAEMGHGDVLVFGAESVGLPAELLDRNGSRTVRLPTTGAVRSLNLSNSVAIAVYELLRRQGWRGETPASGPIEG